MAISKGDSVTFEYTGRLPDGTVFDTSRESVAAESGLTDDGKDRTYEPLSVDVGNERIIEGLEAALVGLEEGDTETVTVSPDAGYGERSDDRIVEYDAAEFEAMLQDREPAEGIPVRTEDGLRGVVSEVRSDVVRVDFNHELAGETLEFDVEIVEVR